jgi:ketosteroid isomerase-like protein
MLYRTGLKIMVSVALATACMGCSKQDPEAALRTRVEAFQEAIGSRDSSAMQHFLSEDFIGNAGMDRRAAKAYAAMLLQRYRQTGVTFGPLSVEMSEPPVHASVLFDAVVTGGSGSMLPEQAGIYAVRTAWREHGGEWLLYRAEWTPRL